MSEAAQKVMPRAVRRAAKAADKAYQEAYGSRDDAAQPPEEQQPTAEVVPLEQPQGEQEEPQQPQGEQEEQPQGQPPETPPAAAQSGDEDSPEKWKQRYQSLQGMIKSRDREIDSLQRSLAALTQLKQEPPQAAPVPQQAAQRAAAKRLRAEDVEAYGEDFIKVIQDAAADVVSTEMEALRRENAELRNRFGGIEKQSVQSNAERVEAYLNQNVPSWRETNEDPEFLEWLQQRDPMSGQQRQSLLDRAGAAFDAGRVAYFFTAYLTESQAIRSHPGASQQPAQQPTAQPPAGRRQPIVDATQMIAPGRPASASGSGAGAASDGEAPPVTESFISQFYDDVTRGKYKQRPKEYNAIQKRIEKSLRDGTVIRDMRAGRRR